MSSVEKIDIFTYLVSLDAEFFWKSHIQNPQRSTLGKNNYMQISGRKSWILEFDLFLIIYLNFNNVAYLHYNLLCFDTLLVLTQHSMLNKICLS